MSITGKLYLITGATGYLGRVLIHKLLEMGARIRALVLPDDPAASALPREVDCSCGTVEDAASMEDFFRGDLTQAYLINCAGVISIATRRDPVLWRVNALGTRNVMEMCLERGVGRVVHVSSVHAIPERPSGETISEVSVFSPQTVRGHYAKSKAAGSAAALDAAARGLFVSVVHPSGIIGPYDAGRSSIAAAVISFCRGKLPAAAEGEYDFVDVRDVAGGIIACSEYGRRGECYILSGHRAGLRDILGHLSRSGYGKEPHYLPLWLVKAVSPFWELHSMIVRNPMFLTPYSAYTLGSNSRFSHRKASDAFGYRPRALSYTLDDMAAWLFKQGLIPAPATSVL